MNKKRKLVFGLDLGTASCGWSVLDIANPNDPEILMAGVRIFPEPRDQKGKTLNVSRREARWARKLIARRKMRKQKTLNLLKRNGMEFQVPDVVPVYQLRAEWLDRELSMSELGRVFYHLSRKRGFKSNRKSGEDKDGAVKKWITSLHTEMESLGCRTLGELRYKQLLANGRAEHWYTSRAMNEEEFDILWKKQSQYKPTVLTESLKRDLYDAIYHQRPLKVKKDTVGQCTFFPEKRRAVKASYNAQVFIVRGIVNNLKSRKKGEFWAFRDIGIDTKNAIFSKLIYRDSITFGQLRKELGMDSVEFNLEKGKGGKDNLRGSKLLSEISSLFPEFKSLNEKDKFLFIETLYTNDDDESTIKSLVKRFWVPQETSIALSKVGIPDGYINLSEKALKIVNPILAEKGEPTRRCFDHAGLIETTDLRGESPWSYTPDFRNPTVTRTFSETRWVLKALIKEFGIPDIARIELARDLKNPKKVRDDIQKSQKKNEENRVRAAKILEESKIQPTDDAILRYLLWEEAEYRCPYTGTEISLTQLFHSGEVDIEHILPYSRSLDNSFKNKTICMAKFNREVKKNFAPSELRKSLGDKWFSEMAVRVGALKMSGWKRANFFVDKIDNDGFIERQLNDTAYASLEIKKFLELLIGKGKVQVTKGWLTWPLRYSWGWNTLINPEGKNEKNRFDHRHHSIDAVVIALSGAGMLNRISKLSAQDKYHRIEEALRDSIPSDRITGQMKDILEKMIISHRPDRKASGRIHEEMAFRDEGGGNYSIRRSIEGIKADDLIKLAKKHCKDRTVRQILIDFATNVWVPGGENGFPLHIDGKTPIKGIRTSEPKNPTVVVKTKTGVFQSDGNHHVIILQHKTKKNIDGTQKRVGVIATLNEVYKRKMNKQEIVNKIWPWTQGRKTYHQDDYEYLFHLHSGDSVKLNGDICILKYIGSWDGWDNVVLSLAKNTEIITKIDNVKSTNKLVFSSGSTTATPIQIDKLGRLW